jgi:hypothetical protein
MNDSIIINFVYDKKIIYKKNKKNINKLISTCEYIDFKEKIDYYHFVKLTFIQYPIKNIFGDNIHTLELRFNFPKPIGYKYNSFLPKNLIKLYLYGNFNSPIGYCNKSYLPDNLYTLVLSSNFNKKLILSKNIKELFLGYEFNQSMDLPLKLNKLYLGNNFNKYIDYLPLTLKTIKFGHNFNQPLGDIPTSLNSIHFGACFNQDIYNLPFNVNFIFFNSLSIFNKSILNLPINLDTLELLGCKFNQPLCDGLGNSYLPKKLYKLSLGSKFNQKITSLPNSLKILYFSKFSEFNQPLFFNSKSILPKLNSLHLGEKFNQHTDFPDSIETLTLGEDFYQDTNTINKLLSKNLKNITIKNLSFKQKVLD